MKEVSNSALDMMRLRKDELRVITADNPEGKLYDPYKTLILPTSACYNLGPGWKTEPCTSVPNGETIQLANFTEGPGHIGRMWFTYAGPDIRDLNLRFYYDDCKIPSMEFPLGDAFCNRWGSWIDINEAEHFRVAPLSGYTLMLPAPFKEGFRVEAENRASLKPGDGNKGHLDSLLFYAIECGKLPKGEKLPEDITYLTTVWSLSDPIKDGIHKVIDLEGEGQMLGWMEYNTPHGDAWWGEAPMHIRLDNAKDKYGTPVENWFQTGFEDAFGHSWDGNRRGKFIHACGRYEGMLPLPPNDENNPEVVPHFGAYRFFPKDLRPNFNERIEAYEGDLGYGRDGQYYTRKDSKSTLVFLGLKELPKKPLQVFPAPEEHRLF